MRRFKKALITGICGSGGSYLAEYIINNQPKTKVYGFYRKLKNENVKNIKRNCRLVKCDMNIFKKVYSNLNKIKPDVIFHIASDADVRKSFDEPMNFINNNNNITLNLLEAIRLLNIDPVIQICSTSEVYGQVKKNETPINENNRMRPASPYAVSKVFQDICAQNYYKNYGLKIIITRMFTYLNPRRLNLFASNWANQIVRIERGKQKVLYHGNLNSTRTVIDIDDAMRSYWVAVSKGKIGEIYNIGGAKTFKISKFLKILKNKSSVKIKSKLDKKLLRKTDVTLQIPNSNKFKKHTGWKPLASFEDSLDKFLKIFRNKK